MRKELEDKLFNDFPDLFKHRNDPNVSLMFFGFECGNGWFDLIYQLCSDIMEYFLTEYDNNDMYYHDVPAYFSVVQVKEKFGSLRFYITSAPEYIHDLIYEAELKSYSICEHCGKEHKQTGKTYTSYYRDKLPWILTLCDDCLDKHIIEKLGRPRRKNETFISDWQRKHKAPFIEG